MEEVSRLEIISHYIIQRYFYLLLHAEHALKTNFNSDSVTAKL